jgi:hypothetical protein
MGVVFGFLAKRKAERQMTLSMFTFYLDTVHLYVVLLEAKHYKKVLPLFLITV